MSDLTTEAGQRLVTAWAETHPFDTMGEVIAAIEEEARADLARRIEARVREQNEGARRLVRDEVIAAIREEAAKP